MKEWSSQCSDDAEFVEFDAELQQITLDAHNKLRNQLATGQVSGYPTAQRMATMVVFVFFYRNLNLLLVNFIINLN